MSLSSSEPLSYFGAHFFLWGGEPADAGKIHSAMGEEQRGGALEAFRGVGPLEVSKNGMDERRFETTYLVLLARPA